MIIWNWSIQFVIFELKQFAINLLASLLLNLGEVEYGEYAEIITAQPLGSILEAKPLRQGQKTRILGRQSQSCSHLYHRLPAPPQKSGSKYMRSLQRHASNLETQLSIVEPHPKLPMN